MMEVLIVGYIDVCSGISERAVDRKRRLLQRSVRATTQLAAAGSLARVSLLSPGPSVVLQPQQTWDCSVLQVARRDKVYPPCLWWHIHLLVTAIVIFCGVRESNKVMSMFYWFLFATVTNCGRTKVTLNRCRWKITAGYIARCELWCILSVDYEN
jgi:hypothetical protein